jgi:hypothetical protein
MRAPIPFVVAAGLLVSAAAAQDPASRAPGRNLLTRYLDWADIHRPAQVGRLTVFPLTLNRSSDRLSDVLTMDQALAKGLLAIEELATARVEQARFINKSGSRMIFLMAGELITGGKQNRMLQTDALLGPDSATVLPLYCVQKGRWKGAGKFDARSTVVPYGVRSRACGRAGQDAIWSEVRRANARLESSTASQDLGAAMYKTENVRRLAGLRERITPHLPRGCVGVVVAVGGRIVAADLFNSPELFSAMRRKVLDSYLSEYGWPVPVRRRHVVPVRPNVTAEQVQEYLRGCYRSRFVSGEMRGVGRIHYVRGVRSGQTLGYKGRSMVHTVLMGRDVLPVRPVPVPRPLPRR